MLPHTPHPIPFIRHVQSSKVVQQQPHPRPLPGPAPPRPIRQSPHLAAADGNEERARAPLDGCVVLGHDVVEAALAPVPRLRNHLLDLLQLRPQPRRLQAEMVTGACRCRLYNRDGTDGHGGVQVQVRQRGCGFLLSGAWSGGREAALPSQAVAVMEGCPGSVSHRTRQEDAQQAGRADQTALACNVAAVKGRARAQHARPRLPHFNSCFQTSVQNCPDSVRPGPPPGSCTCLPQCAVPSTCWSACQAGCSWARRAERRRGWSAVRGRRAMQLDA